MDWSFDGTISKTNTSTFTQASAQTWGVGAEISAGLFGIGLKTSFSWQKQDTRTLETSTSEEFSLGSTVSGKVGAGEQITVATLSHYGQIDINYSSTVTVNFLNVAIPSVSYLENGVFKNAIAYFGKSMPVDNPPTLLLPPPPPPPPSKHVSTVPASMKNQHLIEAKHPIAIVTPGIA